MFHIADHIQKVKKSEESTTIKGAKKLRNCLRVTLINVVNLWLRIKRDSSFYDCFFLRGSRRVESVGCCSESSRNWICHWINFLSETNFANKFKNFTNSSSSGTRDRRSRTSLFVTVWGRMILFENFMIPHISNKALIGIKCSTSKAPNNRRAVSQLNSGTEKLNVLRKGWRVIYWTIS